MTTNDLAVTNGAAYDQDGVYVMAGIDQNTGNVVLGLNDAAATALRLMMEDTASRWTDILDGSAGWPDDVAPDIANTASLLHSLLVRLRAGGY